ncbi:MAG: hypothetical protein JO029_02810 [Candidatus Eremiobacteraeota bacterium]|nr:hypothetical protein [Candidatus Eremiobacteraeota bacterium]MBV8582518.1 hypothetical protein [Candidatus Eremiobacteraeota bacterium]
MKRLLCAFGVAALLPISAFAQSTPASPQRHLVYSFTWGLSNDTQVHTSGMDNEMSGGGIGGSSDSASGMADFSGGTSDKGTITVDVVREQTDTGLVVSVSEQGQETRKAPPATCVVYSDTTIVCDPNKVVHMEELTLLRFLGSHFVDPNQLDAKGHWRVERDGPISSVADYTISKNAAGVMTIDEVRVVKETGAHQRTTNINATVGYDAVKTLPTSISEFTIERSEQGEQYNTVKSQTVLQLQSDSLAAAKN